jgi:hypothetical protein
MIEDMNNVTGQRLGYDEEFAGEYLFVVVLVTSTLMLFQ